MNELPQPNRLLLLDFGRGLAALVIVAHHAVRHLCAGTPGQLWSSSDWLDSLGAILLALLWLPDRLNHEAVLFFFVLSGFCIHYRAAHSMAQGREAPIGAFQFYIRRLVRLYPPLLTALFITLLFDSWSGQFLLSSGISAHRGGTMEAALVEAYRDKGTLLGNALLLMPFFVKPYGTNLALWALGYEVWYYVAYPLWLWLTKNAGTAGAFAVSLGIAGLSVLFLHGRGFPLYPVVSTWWLWCLGAVLAEVHTGRCSWRFMKTVPLWLIIGAGGLVLILLSMFPPRHSLVTYFIWAPVIGGLVYKCAQYEPRRANKVITALSSVGRYSYSLYVSQVPILVLMASSWIYYFGAVPKLPFLPVPGIMLAMVVGWSMALLVERPVEQVRFKALQQK
jgi:peptidoglycan/LPS O-acetylase OafA/YrhL